MATSRAVPADLVHAPMPFSVLTVEPDTRQRIGAPVDISLRAATDQHWASVRFAVPLPGVAPGAQAVVKQWVNDWWPPAAPDLPLTARAALRWIPNDARVPDAPRPAWWVGGPHYQGTVGAAAHLAGTNVEVRLPDGVLFDDPLVALMLSRFRIVRQGSVSWFDRAYHPHRDVPDRGWGDGLVTGLDWAAWAAAPEHPRCPAPDLLDPTRLPRHWRLDATGARSNPRLEHHERQWVAVDGETGDPVLWARATPLGSRHRRSLVARVDGRYRLDWTETPIGWVGSLDAQHGHHVVLLERGDLRVEAWVGLSARSTQAEAAERVDRAFV